MKNWKSKVLYGLLFLLLVACAPQPGAVYTSKGLFHSSNQCKAMARKQLQLARNAGKSKRNHWSLVAAASQKKSHQVTSIPYAEEKFVYSRYLLQDTVSFPEALASLSEGGLQLSASSKTRDYLSAFPTKNLSAKHLYNAGYSQVNKRAAKADKPERPLAATIKNKSAEKAQLTRTQTQDNSIALFFGLSGILSAGLLGTLLQKFRKVSEWASQNLGKARALLVFIRIFTALSALAAGNYLAHHGIGISETSKDAAVAVATAAAILYPVRNSRFRLFNGGYLRRKLHDLALFVSGTLMMVYAGNRYEFVNKPAAPSQTVFSFAAFNKPANTISLVRKTITPVANDTDTPKKHGWEDVVGKIFLTILVAALWYLLAVAVGALACNLMCSGLEALGWIVLLGGEIGAIVLAVVLLKKIFRKKKSVETKEN